MSKQRTYHIKKICTNPDQAFLLSLVPTGEVTRVIIACVGSKFGSVEDGLCCNHNSSNFTMRK